MTLEQALAMANGAVAHATALGCPISVAVVDAAGHTVVKLRMDGARFLTATIAENKAYTAAALGMPSGDLQPLIQPGAPVFGLNEPRIITFAGGLPITIRRKLAGGIGVSGGTVEQDVEIARAGLAA